MLYPYVTDGDGLRAFYPRPHGREAASMQHPGVSSEPKFLQNLKPHIGYTGSKLYSTEPTQYPLKVHFFGLKM